MNKRLLLPAVLFLMFATALTAFAQSPGSWSAMLTVQPFPSPYVSDWQQNPSIASLTIVNGTGMQQMVTISLGITNSNGQQIISGTSGQTVLLPGSNVLNNTSVLHGNIVYNDAGIKSKIIATGRAPEGSYTACVTVSDLSGNILVSNVCAAFTIVYPDPPHLAFPIDGDSVTTTYPVFQWTPIQVPIQYQLHYVMKIAEVLPGQTPEQALAANVPQYVNNNIMATTLQYPISGLPLKPGRIYAWQVQALDQNGFPPSSNEGRSEIWTFKYKKPAVVVFHPINPPPPPPPPPPPFVFLTNTIVTGHLYGTYYKPLTGVMVINNPSGRPTFPLKNTTVKLVVKYMLVEHTGNSFQLGKTVERSVPRGKLPVDHRYNDADQVVATTVTDPSGNFTFSFPEIDSTGLLAKNKTINFQGGEFTDNHTGDLYKVYRVIVQNQYYCSPDKDIIVQPHQIQNAGSFPALVRTYSLRVTVMPGKYQAAAQQTQGPLGGTYVYILRKNRPLGVPASEGSPNPLSPQTVDNMKVVAVAQAGKNGRATFQDLVKNIGPNDQYFIYAKSDPKGNLLYYCFASSFQFDYQLKIGGKTNYSVSPSNAYDDQAVFNSGYVAPTVSTVKTMAPMFPRVAGVVVRADNPLVKVSGAKAELLDYKVLFWGTERSQLTHSNGSFSFDNLLPVYDNGGNISGPLRVLRVSKYGYKTLTYDINKNNGQLSPLKLGQQLYIEQLPLQPSAKVTGRVVDEKGNPVRAMVTIGQGTSVKANIPQFIMKYSPVTHTRYASVNYNTGFKSTAVLGYQKIIIDPGIFDNSFFADTEYVNITQDGQNLGTFVVKKKEHRIRVVVSVAGNYMMRLPVKGANVNIEGVGNLKADNNGIADTTFVSSSDNFKIQLTAPAGMDFEGKTVSAYVPESKNWIAINVRMKRASHVSGTVFAGNTPIPGAHVFLNQSHSADAPVVETYTDNNGAYVLHNVPIGRSLTISAAKSQSNYIGDSRRLNVSSSGKDKVNFKLKVYDGMNITRLLGFPIEVTALSSSNGRVYITGDFTTLPANSVFGPLDSTLSIQFHNIAIVPGTAKDSNNVPYAVPKTLPLTTELNNLPLKIYGSLIGAQKDDSHGIRIGDAGNGNGEFSNPTYIGAGSFTADPAFSNIKFPGDAIYLDIPGEPNKSKRLQVPAIEAGGITPGQISNGILLSDADGNSMHYTLYGFDAVADSSLSRVYGDTVKLATTIHTNLIHVSKPDVDFNIGDVTLHSKAFDPIQGHDTISIKLDKWTLEGDKWSVSQSGGFVMNSGVLRTGSVNVPFSGVQITPTEFKYGNFHTGSMSLSGVLPLTITGKFFFGYDGSKGHWSLNVMPQPDSSVAAYAANLPGSAPGDRLSINNFYLLSSGDNGFTMDNSAPAMTLYKVASFQPTMLVAYPTYVHVPGTMDVHVPGLKPQSSAVDYSLKSGKVAMNLVTFPFSFDTKGVHLEFTADKSHPETLDQNGFVATGTVSEEGKFSFNVVLYRTADSTSIWVIPGQKLNISQDGATSMSNIAGSMAVAKGAWNNFSFAGDMTGTNGAGGRLTFVVYGDIVADNQQIQVNNIQTPFGNLRVTYDFKRHVLEGYLQISKDLAGGAHIEGAADAVVDLHGWYFVAGASLTLTNPHVDGNAAIVFGDHPMADSILAIVKKYSWIYQKKGKLPSQFPATVSGFYFEGEMSIPVPVIPSFDFDFGLVSAHLYVNVGGDIVLSMQFSGSGNTYGTGIDIFADVNAGVGASIGIACGGLSAEVLAEVLLDGQYQSNGNWYVDGGATLTLSGTTYCGWGVCDSNCGGSLCDKSSASATVVLGVIGHYGTDYHSVKFFFK